MFAFVALPYGDFPLALFRIDDYRAGAVTFNDWETPEDMLKLVADLARELEGRRRGRKTIVCIGSPAVCNSEEPERNAPRSTWPSWVDALTESAVECLWS